MKDTVNTYDRLKWVLENFVESHNGEFEFPDGDVMDCKKVDQDVKFEKTSELMHEMWVQLMTHFLANNTDDTLWKFKVMVKEGYSDLTEDEKAEHKLWAKKVLSI